MACDMQSGAGMRSLRLLLVLASFAAVACGGASDDGAAASSADATAAGFLDAGTYRSNVHAIASATFEADQPWGDDGMGWGRYRRVDTDGVAHEGDFVIAHDNLRGWSQITFGSGHEPDPRSLDTYRFEHVPSGVRLTPIRWTDGAASADDAGAFTLVGDATATGERLHAGDYRLGLTGIASLTLARDDGATSGDVSFGRYQRVDLDGRAYEGEFSYAHDNIRDRYEMVFTVDDGDAPRRLDVWAAVRTPSGIELTLLDAQLAETGAPIVLTR